MAYCSVTRGQPTLRSGINPGNWVQYPIDLDCWNASRSKAPAPKDGSAAYQVVVGVAYLLAYDGYGL